MYNDENNIIKNLNRVEYSNISENDQSVKNQKIKLNKRDESEIITTSDRVKKEENENSENELIKMNSDTTSTDIDFNDLNKEHIENIEVVKTEVKHKHIKTFLSKKNNPKIADK